MTKHRIKTLGDGSGFIVQGSTNDFSASVCRKGFSFWPEFPVACCNEEMSHHLVKTSVPSIEVKYSHSYNSDSLLHTQDLASSTVIDMTNEDGDAASGLNGFG